MKANPKKKNIWKKYSILSLLLIPAGILFYIYWSFFAWSLPLLKTYTDPLRKFSFQYPINGNIILIGPNPDIKQNIVRVFLGKSGWSTSCDLFIDSGYENPSAQAIESFNDIEWNTNMTDPNNPPRNGFYDARTSFWWVESGDHHYRWQIPSISIEACRGVIKTFKFL